jgi:hypothetical protein
VEDVPLETPIPALDSVCRRIELVDVFDENDAVEDDAVESDAELESEEEEASE